MKTRIICWCRFPRLTCMWWKTMEGNLRRLSTCSRTPSLCCHYCQHCHQKPYSWHDWHFINIIDAIDTSSIIMHDYWLLMMRKTMRIGGGNHLWHDWHIVKIIDTINTPLWGLTSWLTHHKDYWYNQHLIMKTNLENGGRGAWRRIGENSWDLGFLWSNFYFVF